MSLILEEEDAMFTGDNVLGQGTTVFEDLSTYLNSLEKMRGMFSGRAYPGHGPVIEDGTARIAEYIKHRQQREEQVIEVLSSPKSSSKTSEDKEAADWDSMEIVKVIYHDVPDNLHVPAQGGVMQVLRKLQQEDKVAVDPSTNRWRIRRRAAL
jgi:glyoxylase-like metal-dependent hydrolase (beta-lactamase superfamily II)